MKTKLLCVTGLLLAILALFRWGHEPPVIVQCFEIGVLSALAMAFGFTSLTAPTGWMRSPHIRGVICVYIGIGTMFVPANFIVSAFFLGCGCRLCVTDFEKLGPPPGGASNGVTRTEIIRRENGEIVR